MLHEAGYKQRKESKELVLVDPGNEVEFFYLRPRDIAIYVASGKLDIGITGRDLLLDSGANAEEILELGFARSTFRYATRPGTASGPADFSGMTIATSYEGIVAKHLADHGIDASVVHLDGAVETAIQLECRPGHRGRRRDRHLAAQRRPGGGRRADPHLRGRGGPPHRRPRPGPRGGALPAPPPGRAGGPQLRDDGLRLPCGAPGAGRRPDSRPGVADHLPLHNEGWVAVRAMVPAKDAQRIMDDLYALGARAILTTAIHACRL